jgi:hypothetical protein
VLAPGDPSVLATMLAALVTTYLSEAMDGTLDGRFTREDLHALIDRTFRKPA